MEMIMTFLTQPVALWALAFPLLAAALLLFSMKRAFAETGRRLSDAKRTIGCLQDERRKDIQDLDNVLDAFVEIVGTAVPRRNGRLLDPHGRDHQAEIEHPGNPSPEEIAAVLAYDAARANAESLRRLLHDIRMRCDCDCPAVERNVTAMMHNAGLLTLQAPEAGEKAG